PSRKDWDLLFQPLFDELLTHPPSVDPLAPKFIAPIAEVITLELAKSTGSPSSTTVNQDAPSLRLQISQSPRGIFINQSKYALESLKKYGFESCDPVDTPMVEKSKLDEDKEGKAIDLSHYSGSANRKALTCGKKDLSTPTRNRQSGSMVSKGFFYCFNSICRCELRWLSRYTP
nr:hypothetical protein [Tanacetum cinerariifolium]